MSVIIRLQNLPWSANALDIRQFFQGLSIPEGGVHIVGGELGDAFIAFSTDEDARQAFARNNGRIKEVQITLMLSSRTEMQRVIEAARTQSYAAFMQTTPTTATSIVATPNNVPTPSVVAATNNHIQPAAVPNVLLMPAAVPPFQKTATAPPNASGSTSSTTSGGSSGRDHKLGSSSRRDRKRSRSRSRERNKEHKSHRRRSSSRSKDERRSSRHRRSRSKETTSNSSSRSKRSSRRSRSRSRRSKSREDRTRTNQNAVVPTGEQPLVWSAPPTIDLTIPLQTLQQPPPQQQQAPPPLQQQFPPMNNPSLMMNMMMNMTNSWGQTNGNSGSGFRPHPHHQQHLPQHPPQFHQQQRQPQAMLSNNTMLNFGGSGGGPETSIRLHPFYGGYGGVRRFFHGSYINADGIKLLNDQYGQRMGVTLVKFAHVQGKMEALRRHGEPFNGTPIHIEHISNEEFNIAVDRYTPATSIANNANNGNNNGAVGLAEDLGTFVCVSVENLPSYAKEQDILKVFSQRPVINLFVVHRPRGGTTAYVQFAVHEEAVKALDDTANHVVDGRIVVVRPCSDRDFEAIQKQRCDPDLTDDSDNNHNCGDDKLVDTEAAGEGDDQDEDENEEEEKRKLHLNTDCISISHLPPQTTNVEVADFFSDIGVRPQKIHLISNRMVGFTGQAYCEFNSVEEVKRALSKNNVQLGQHTVAVRAIPRRDMEAFLSSTQPSDVVQQAQSASLLPTPPRLPYFGPRGPPMPPPPPSHRFMGNGGRGGGLPPPRMSRPPRFANCIPSDDAPPGCTVFLDNIPYKAGTNEILDFFAGFDVGDHVSRRFNPNNTPSAEARVLFKSAEEAFRAVQAKGGCKIWDRPIYLKQA